MNRSHKAYLLTIVGAEYLTGMVPIGEIIYLRCFGYTCISNRCICDVGTHDWSKYIKPEELRLMLAANTVRMDVREAEGMVLKPPSLTAAVAGGGGGLIQWRLSARDLDVNYIMHAVKKVAPASTS